MIQPVDQRSEGRDGLLVASRTSGTGLISDCSGRRRGGYVVAATGDELFDRREGAAVTGRDVPMQVVSSALPESVVVAESPSSVAEHLVMVSGGLRHGVWGYNALETSANAVVVHGVWAIHAFETLASVVVVQTWCLGPYMLWRLRPMQWWFRGVNNFSDCSWNESEASKEMHR
nr:hypothetical protein Iba_chr12bCG10910 [Ipomoea batatas]